MSNFYPRMWFGTIHDEDLDIHPAVYVVLPPDKNISDDGDVYLLAEEFDRTLGEASPDELAAFFARWRAYAERNEYPVEINDDLYEEKDGMIVLAPEE
jgi:hypothetical protein